MKILFSILLCVLALEVRAQYPTVTSSLSYSRTISSHGFSVGEWLTVDDNGDIVSGTDPSTQPFIGVVSKVVSANVFEYAPPGGPITLSGLTAGEIYYAQDDGTLEPASTATDTNKPVLKAISTTQAILYSGAFGAADLPPPSTQVQNISFSDISSTSVTATASGGDGSGVIMLISLNPINFSPQNNVDYSGAENLNFGSGNDVSGGSGVYVVLYGDESSAVITGLSAASTYHIHAYRYVTSGGLISYNLSTQGFNTASVNTFADASTPTQQWQKVSVKPLETSIRVTGTRGNGDQILVVASTDSIPDTDPSDAVDYSLGEALGNGFIAYKGTSTTFDITGLTRDRKVYYKVFEREDTGYLYNTQTEVDSAWTCYFYIDTWTQGAGDPAGETYLESNAYVYYDFSDLTFADEANITNGDAGLVDQGPNANTGTVVGVPTTNEITLNSAARKAARSSSTQAISTGNTGVSWFTNASGFEIHHVFRIEDGVTTGAFHSTCGGGDNTYRVLIRFNATGNLQLQYVYNTNFVTWTSTSAVLADGANQLVVQAKFDFVNDTFSAWVDGVSEPGSSSGFPISSVNPATWTTTENFYVVNHNIAGTAGTHHSAVSMARFAITPILTDQQRSDIHDFFAFTASGTSGILGWEITESAGFDQSVDGDSLVLSGNAGGYLDFMTKEDILPDSLQDLVARMTFKIDGSLTTNPSGLGIGVRNATVSEPNRSAFGQISLDTDANSFGKAEIFQGTGSTGNGSVAFASQSSGELEAAEDSIFTIEYKRTISGNDVLNSITVEGYDSTLVTTSALEPNRPSSEYYGTSMKAFIWFQGPAFKVIEYFVLRLSEAQVETAPPPTPVTGVAYVQIGGSDGNSCAITAPCATVQRGVERATELGGGTVVVGVGSFPLSTYLNVPSNVNIQGSGKLTTTITPAPNLYWPWSYSTDSRAMLRLISSSTTSSTQFLKDFTMVGGVQGDRNVPTGVWIKYRDGVTIENVRFEYFNTHAVGIQYLDDIHFTGCDFHESSGSGGNQVGGSGQPAQNPETGYPFYGPATSYSFPAHPQSGGFSSGQITMFDAISDLEIDNCTFTGGWGTGYGTKTSAEEVPNGPFVAHDHHIHDNYFNQYPFTADPWFTFNMEYHGGYSHASAVWGNFEFNNNETTTGALSLVTESKANGYTHRIHHNLMRQTDTNWYVEIQSNYLEIDNNYFINGGYIGFSSGNVTLTNHHWHHNVIEVSNNVSSARGLFWKNNGTLNNVTIEYLSINFTGSSGGQWSLVRLQTSTHNVTVNTLVARNIAFYGAVPSSSNIWQSSTSGGRTATYNSSSISYCFATNANLNQVVSGISRSNLQTGQNGSAWWTFAGARPQPYYNRSGSSPLTGAGTSGTNVGAY